MFHDYAHTADVAHQQAAAYAEVANRFGPHVTCTPKRRRLTRLRPMLHLVPAALMAVVTRHAERHATASRLQESTNR
jgi:hypothetical protein